MDLRAVGHSTGQHQPDSDRNGPRLSRLWRPNLPRTGIVLLLPSRLWNLYPNTDPFKHADSYGFIHTYGYPDTDYFAYCHKDYSSECYVDAGEPTHYTAIRPADSGANVATYHRTDHTADVCAYNAAMKGARVWHYRRPLKNHEPMGEIGCVYMVQTNRGA